MPLFEYLCLGCGHVTEALITRSDDQPVCEACQSHDLKKLISASSSASGPNQGRMPGASDTACCGSAPGMAAGCAGPGSCCGKSF
ncbi:MAG: zinc ribbon domain-containing protein [Proteobacteria bacterium]|nr:zinc ribbon domain-containing protein [Pseudomonadota bacterium]